MKKYGRFLFLILPVLLATSCISLKIKPLFPADNQFEDMILCTQVEEKGGLFSAEDPNTTFSTESQKIICLVRLQNVNVEITVRWKWYDPKNKLVRDQEELVNYQDKLHSILTFVDELDLSSKRADVPTGEWTVVFILNGRMADRTTFKLKPPPTRHSFV